MHARCQAKALARDGVAEHALPAELLRARELNQACNYFYHVPYDCCVLYHMDRERGLEYGI